MPVTVHKDQYCCHNMYTALCGGFIVVRARDTITEQYGLSTKYDDTNRLARNQRFSPIKFCPYCGSEKMHTKGG